VLLRKGGDWNKEGNLKSPFPGKQCLYIKLVGGGGKVKVGRKEGRRWGFTFEGAYKKV
jgi:hypothetical protein